MSKEIIINSGKQTRIAILEDGDLVELFIENQEHERTIGNIFLARVRRIMPSIQAAFVDIGQKQDAFLHFSDLVENVTDWLQFVDSDKPVIGTFKVDYVTRPTRKNRRRPRGHESGSRSEQASSHKHVADKDRTDRRKSALKRQHGQRHGKDESHDDDAPPVDPTTYLRKDQRILVKISKEPIANKGSRVTTDISLAGRFLVLVPMANYVAVSKKIQSFKERRRLRALANSLLPEGFGVIVRTVASGKNAKSLDTDLNLLLDKWRKIESRLANNPKAPVELHVDVNMASSIMRDLFTDDYDRILIDDHRTFKNIKGYVQAIAPQMADAVHEYTGSEPVFKSAGIDQQVEEAFESRVNLPSGGYLFIEQTEAMHVVDVNSGRSGRGMSQEDSSLKVNLESARVIAQQVRLRDLGGIIVIDFIDMRHERNRKKVYDEIRNEFRKDRAVTKVLPMSDFGLMQITRQRLRPSITKTFSLPEDDNAAPRSSRAELPLSTARPERTSRPDLRRAVVASATPEELLKGMEAWIEQWLANGKKTALKLVVHPFTAAFLNKRIPNQTTRWFLRHLLRVKIVVDPKMDPLDFVFLDAASGKEAVIEEKAPPPESTSRSGEDQRESRGRSRGDGRGRDRRGNGSGSDENASRRSSRTTESTTDGQRRAPARRTPDRDAPKGESDDRQKQERQRPERRRPERQEPEQRRSERQEPEQRRPERQEPERQKPEKQEPERKRPERRTPERASSPERPQDSNETGSKPNGAESESVETAGDGQSTSSSGRGRGRGGRGRGGRGRGRGSRSGPRPDGNGPDQTGH